MSAAASELGQLTPNCATPRPTNGLFLFDPAQLAFGNEPAFSAQGTHHTIFDDLLAKAPEQAFLGFVWPKGNSRQFLLTS
jgi:hypothetical protein